jgi:hypothetical protein
MYLEVAVYAMGGRRRIIFISEGREGWGWSRFATKLGKVRAFLEVSVGSGLVRPALALKKFGKLVEPGLVQSCATIGGSGSFGKVDTPSFAEVLRTATSHLEVEKMLMLLVYHHFGDKLAGEAKLTGERNTHSPRWEWKCQLEKLKDEVD